MLCHNEPFFESPLKQLRILALLLKIQSWSSLVRALEGSGWDWAWWTTLPGWVGFAAPVGGSWVGCFVVDDDDEVYRIVHNFVVLKYFNAMVTAYSYLIKVYDRYYYNE